MKVNIKIDVQRLKNLVRHALHGDINFTTEVHCTNDNYLILSTKDGVIFITAIYDNNVLTHMADVSYATFLDLIGELEYSDDDFKIIISRYI